MIGDVLKHPPNPCGYVSRRPFLPSPGLFRTDVVSCSLCKGIMGVCGRVSQVPEKEVP